MSIGSARRYYLGKRLGAARGGDPALGGAWRALQEAEPGTSLSGSFPARSKLVAAGYSTVEDIDGADVSELQAAGLTRAEATAALAAI